MDDLDKQYPYPVWGTQGGGLVALSTTGGYAFVVAPKDTIMGLKVGDQLPKDWMLTAANQRARDHDDRPSAVPGIAIKTQSTDYRDFLEPSKPVTLGERLGADILAKLGVLKPATASG